MQAAKIRNFAFFRQNTANIQFSRHFVKISSQPAGNDTANLYFFSIHWLLPASDHTTRFRPSRLASYSMVSASFR